MIRGSVKVLWVLGMLSLLLAFTYGMVAGEPGEAVKDAGPPTAMLTSVVAGDGGQVSASLTEYVFLHQNRHEDMRIHEMAGMTACPE